MVLGSAWPGKWDESGNCTIPYTLIWSRWDGKISSCSSRIDCHVAEAEQSRIAAPKPPRTYTL